MEVPAEAAEQPPAAEQQVAAEANTEAAPSAEAEEADASAPATKGENQKLLKKIDIDGMFKKFSPTNAKTAAAAKKTAVKGKPKTDVKSSQKKIAPKSKKPQVQKKEVKKSEEAEETAPA